MNPTTSPFPVLARGVLSIAALIALSLPAEAASVKLFEEKPVSIKQVNDGVTLVDFGRVSFGNLELVPPAGADAELTVHFGEAFTKGRVERKPPGTVRYAAAKVKLRGAKPVIAAPPADKRNTEVDSPRHPPAVLTPKEWGVVLPFRWVEIEGWPGELKAEQITRRSAFSSTWDDDAAAFECSDEMLNRIWEMCRYSIKATTFAGVYVDGDRERIPYEADAYLNQLSHYATDNDLQVARDTYDWLMKYPTWPTEWASHMVFMAHADWRHSGDTKWLAPRYEALKEKLLLDRVGPDGLVTSTPQQIKKGDIVDWPKGERDGYVFTEVNTVVNAFYLAALGRMAELANALGKEEDAKAYRERVQKTGKVFQEKLFDAKRGVYVDGIGTDHASLHANLFPLAFRLVPSERKEGVAKFVVGKGMACSVYVAQYLMEALFENGEAEAALQLITAPGDRSWRHMVESGTTISWEAWDLKYKPNQDWNHAWGAAPANLLPRYVLGAQASSPGWRVARIRPHPGGLSAAKGRVPTPLGPVEIDWQRGKTFRLELSLPKGMIARVDLPVTGGAEEVLSNGKKIAARRHGDRWVLEKPVSGKVTLEVR